MRLVHVYLLFCVAGLILPYAWFAPWLVEHGVDLPRLLAELFSTRVGGFFGIDVIVSALVLAVFVLAEGRRLGIRHRWLPIVATLAAGVSLGLPLFLYQRQRALDTDAARGPTVG